MKQQFTQVTCDYCKKFWHVGENNSKELGDGPDFCCIEHERLYYFEQNKVPIPYLSHIEKEPEFFRYKDRVYYKLIKDEYREIIYCYDITEEYKSQKSGDYINCFLIVTKEFGKDYIGWFGTHQYEHCMGSIYINSVDLNDGKLLRLLIEGKSNLDLLKNILDIKGDE